ncbi:MAG: hypothetical protein Roseis2KO_39860 [Roseivirga sp.]
MQKTLSLTTFFSLILALTTATLITSTSSGDDCEECGLYTEMLPQFECSDDGQLGMNVCSLEEFQYYDSILNQRYSKLMKFLELRLKEEETYQSDELNEYEATIKYKEAIIKSQRAWLNMRIANEEVQRQRHEGGSMQPMAINRQATVDTRHRICYLEELLHYE